MSDERPNSPMTFREASFQAHQELLRETSRELQILSLAQRIYIERIREAPFSCSLDARDAISAAKGFYEVWDEETTEQKE